jgi:hypothetical protein
MSFKAYAQNIQTKTGKSIKEYYTLAQQQGFIVNEKMVATHAQMLNWLKNDMKIGHVYANFIITYFKLRTNDPKLTQNTKKWASETGYQEKEKSE